MLKYSVMFDDRRSDEDNITFWEYIKDDLAPLNYEPVEANSITNPNEFHPGIRDLILDLRELAKAHVLLYVDEAINNRYFFIIKTICDMNEIPMINISMSGFKDHLTRIASARNSNTLPKNVSRSVVIPKRIQKSK